MEWEPEDTCYEGYSLLELGITPKQEKERMKNILQELGFKEQDTSDDKFIEKCFAITGDLLYLVRHYSNEQITELDNYYKETGRISGVVPIDLKLVYDIFELLLKSFPDIPTILYVLTIEELAKHLTKKIKQKFGKKGVKEQKELNIHLTVINNINIIADDPRAVKFRENMNAVASKHPGSKKNQDHHKVGPGEYQ